MNKIILISDSSCDLSFEDEKALDVEIVPFYSSYDGKTYQKDRVEIENDSFYKTLLDSPKLRPKTTCPSSGEYYEVFEKHIKEGKAVICICLTQKFSGSYNSANVAKNMLLEEYPNAKIAVIDSTLITLVQGLLVKEVYAMIKEGMDFQQIVDNVEEIKKTGRIFFTIDTMEYLDRGGRMGKVVTVLTSKVGIKPIIYFSEGDITAKGVTFGRKKSMTKVIDKFNQYFIDNKYNLDDYNIAVGYGGDKEEGIKFLERVQSVINLCTNKVKLTLEQIGSTIAVHTGPLPIGIGFLKKHAVN